MHYQFNLTPFITKGANQVKTENSLACCAQGMPASMAASYQRLLQNVGNGLGQQSSEVKMAECCINGNSGWLQGATENVYSGL